MHIVVTGGAGYIGTRVVQHLLDRGLRVTVFDKLLYGGEGLIPLVGHKHFHLVVGDIRSEPLLKSALSNVDAVVHLAAIVGDAACAVDPDSAYDINYRGAEIIARLASELKIERLIFVSTCSNYGVSDASTYADEDTPLNPLSLYAESKTRAERIILDSRTSPYGTCVLRLGTVCGLSARMRFNLMVNEMARAAALGERISVFSPAAWRPFLNINDAAHVIFYCLTTSSLHGGVFNVVSENYQKCQLVDLVRKHYPHIMVDVSEKNADPRNYRVTAGRIAEQMGFKPAYTVEDAFLEVASAVRNGIFVDPHRALYEAVPDARRLRL